MSVEYAIADSWIERGFKFSIIKRGDNWLLESEPDNPDDGSKESKELRCWNIMGVVPELVVKRISALRSFIKRGC